MINIKAEIISVGTELLLGDIVDTNAAFLSRGLAELGIGVYRRLTIGDNLERMTEAFRDALKSADLVIATGGLGPTADDITKEAAAACFGLRLNLDDGILDGIRQFFEKLGSRMTENNVQQAYMPEGSITLENKNGTAPGCYIEKDGKIIALLPGPPHECEPMFNDVLRPLLMKKQDATLVSKTVKMCGIGESAMETHVRDMLDSRNPTVAPYSGGTEVRLRITARAADEQEARRMIEPVKNELYARLGGYIYGEDEATLEGTVISLLKEKGLKLALAESCTGGALAARLTGVAGCSDVFLESAVTYSNDAKASRLGVNPAALAEYGAVSPETAKEMAEGIARTSGADIGLSITGIAGPGGGTDEKPVGLVYHAIYANGTCEVTETRLFGSRDRIRARAAVKALELLWRYLK